MKYYIDNYSSGTARDISGPYASLTEAREHVDGVKVSVAPYDGVVEQLGSDGEPVEMVEAWAMTGYSEGYQAIYRVGESDGASQP